MSDVARPDEEVAALLSELRRRDIGIQLDGEVLRVRGAKAKLTADLTQRIQHRKSEMIGFLRAAGRVAAYDTPIERRASDAPIELSFMQRNLWLIDQLAGSAHYNIPSVIDIEGPLSACHLERALRTVVERHESLRTVFRTIEDGTPRQVVLEQVDFRITEIDLTHLAEQAQWVEVRRLARAEAQRPFDLSRDLMMRSTLLRFAQDRFVLLNTIHHIAADAASLDVLLEEMGRLYEAYRNGEDNPLSPLPIQYADYSTWLSQWLQGELLEKKLEYWRRQLANLPSSHSLPLDRPRPSHRTIRGERHSRLYPRHLYDALLNLCSAHDATLFMLIEAAFATFLSRWSGERDIAIATPVSTRDRPELASMIGYFGNVLVLRSNCDEAASFLDFLYASKAMILDAHEHRHAAFESVVAKLNPVRSLAYNPLVQISFVLLTQDAATTELLTLPGLKISARDCEHVAMKFDLELTVSAGPQGLRFAWSFNVDLFDRATIEHMDRQLEILLESITADPCQRLSQLPVPRAPVVVAVDETGHRRSDTGSPASTAFEQGLMELWIQLLDRAPAGTDSNLFDSGGSSMLAVRLVAAIRQRFAVEMPLRVVFEHPRIADLAQWLAGQKNIPAPGHAVPPQEPARMTLGSHTERMLTAIWAAHLQMLPEEIDVSDSFFEIGGNSVLSIAVQADIRETLGVAVAIADLFEYPTIRDLGRLIDGGTRQTTDRASALRNAKSRVLQARARARGQRSE